MNDQSTPSADATVLSRAEGLGRGHALRERIPRTALGVTASGSRDPLGVLAQQDATRVPELVPMRAERMAASPFAFYRGTAAVMAADLAREQSSGILVRSCGDAHIGNFGFYASPQRTLTFDLNDFDEAAWAPWEWDLKRLVASVVIGARGVRDAAVGEDAARASVIAYARALRSAVELSPVDRYYAHLDATKANGLDETSRAELNAAITSAQKRTGARAVRKLTVADASGHPVFVESPPVTTRADDEIRARVTDTYTQYLASANIDIRALLRQYDVRDVVRRVVGVGSVGTRCYLALLGSGDDEAMILQVKEADRSVLEQYGGITQPAELQRLIDAGGEGARVVGLQRVLQAFSDPFLGHIRMPGTHYYVRQFHDMKGSIDTDVIEDAGYREYAVACAITLARAHAQSPNASIISGYLGGGKEMAEVLLGWADAYATISAADHQAFVAAH